MLERITKIPVDSIPMNDEETISLFKSNKALNADESYDEKTGAVGLPEFGTSFVRQILNSTQPAKFSDLVKISGLSHGTDVWLNNAKNLIESRVTTFEDVIGCRDDIMLYLIHKGLPSKAAFEIMEAIRKGKGLKDEQKTMLANFKVPQWYIDSCQRIKYLFPKAHAVAYVLMAVRVAWFKVHYPLHYYAVYFTLRCSSYEYETMVKPTRVVRARLLNIQQRLNDMNLKKDVSSKEVDLISTLEAVYEMNSRGYKIAPLDLLLSHATEFILHPDDPTALIPPFVILDGLGENVAKSIIEARQIKAFISKEDLQKRTLINNTQINRFEDLGLLDGLDDKNQMSLF
jgi:DNA polymerase-3 subunit alpha (Gram-positive type)